MKLFKTLLLIIVICLCLYKVNSDELSDCLVACQKEDNLYIQDICDFPSGNAIKKTPTGRFAANQLKSVCETLELDGKINFGNARKNSKVSTEPLEHCMYVVCFNGVPTKAITDPTYAPPTRPSLFSKKN